MTKSDKAYEFKAEVKQVLDILIHSLYTNKEIFLRELVSNASDALDKQRIQSALAENGEDDLELEIRIDLDKEAKTLTVTDTGIGMTRDELIQNIGTIAHSGTADFLAKARESGSEGLDGIIGKFGVGFYSVYMVADEVTVTTKSFKDEPAMEWKSDGQGAYEIREVQDGPKRGSVIAVRLKDEVADQFTDKETIKQVLKKHSNFISFPILVEGDRVNTVPALWREPKFQIKPEQYKEFYSFLTYDSEEPFETMHVSVDAPVQFTGLLFIPGKDRDFLGMDRENWGLDLYVRRVLIQRQSKDLLPRHLSFVAGVVDTEDLPLNVSRETLQDNLLIRKIQTTLTKHVLKELEKISKDNAERYAEFWNEHGETFKTGYVDFLNRDKFAALLRFNSSASEDQKGLVSLDQYIERAKADQKEIYYAFCASREAAKLNPHLEIFRKKGVEVLYLYEPIDEFIMDTLREHNEFKLVAAEHADLGKLEKFESVAKDKKAKKMSKKDSESLPGLLKRIKEILGDDVTEVKASERLTDSPVCLANPDGAVTSSMDKIMRIVSKDSTLPKKILEVNPDHELMRNLIKVFQNDPADPFIEQASRQLFESAMLLEGYLQDPHALVGRIQDLLTSSSSWHAKDK